MTERSRHRVSAWAGRFGSRDALEAYLTPTFTEDGAYREAPFERDFGIRINPYGREAEWVGDFIGKKVADTIRGFSYVEQFRFGLSRDLADANLAGCDSLFLVYDHEGEPRAGRSDRMTLLGTYRYDPRA